MAMRRLSTSVVTLVVTFALLLCGCLPVFAMYEPIDYMDIDVPDTLDAVQWFPCREGFENDDLWEVQCFHDGDTTLAQRFTETAEDTGNTNYLDTVYNADGSLTVTRNGADGEAGIYTPYVRTLLFEHVPYWNADIGNTLHFDFEATAGWSITLSFATQYTIVLDGTIAQACGVELTNGVGAAGRYTGTLNMPETLRAIAQTNNACSEAASAVLTMEQIPVPQLTIYCVGDVGSSVTMHKWLISSPEDPQGENCYFACMALMTEIVYSIEADCFPLSMTTATEQTPTNTSSTTATTTTAAPTTTTAAPTASTAGSVIPFVTAGIGIALVIVLVCVMRKVRLLRR